MVVVARCVSMCYNMCYILKHFEFFAILVIVKHFRHEYSERDPGGDGENERIIRIYMRDV